jgi:formylglycine-generating enzyme required for sulfatase activity
LKGDDSDEPPNGSSCAYCPEMVVVPAGKVITASKTISIERPFAVGKYEITFSEWDACVQYGGCSHSPSDEGWGRDNRPVINATWQDAKEYVKWLSDRTGDSYRLLTEDEWEYAARAGLAEETFWGGSTRVEACRFANVYDNASQRKYQFKDRDWHRCKMSSLLPHPSAAFKGMASASKMFSATFENGRRNAFLAGALGTKNPDM